MTNPGDMGRERNGDPLLEIIHDTARNASASERFDGTASGFTAEYSFKIGFRPRQIARGIQTGGMFSIKQLSEDQIAAIKSWAADGAQLPEIQKRITEEFKLTVSYMDTRFAILDLGIELVEPKKEEPATEITETTLPTGKTTVTMDSIAVPGTLVSGKVEFSDGETALWSLDETGRPSLDPAKPDYQPSKEDIMEFQTQLRALIQSTGL